MTEEKRHTSSNIEIPKYLGDFPLSDAEKVPGEFPYTRGIHETMYTSRPWTMRQYAGFSTAKESNERYKELLAKGAKGLSVAFDLPTQMGFDSDHKMSIGEVGKVGVAIDSIEDMRELFDGIDLSCVSTSMTINATAAILLSMYVCVAEEKGISASQISGTIQNDILKEYIARGTYIYPPEPSLRIITNIFQYCAKEIPRWNTISISGYHIREAGSTAVQELAFTLANGITYVEKAIEAGLDIDDFAPRLSFFFNVHNNFMEEIAKFRAARKMWANIMKNDFGAKNEKSLKLRFHSQVAGSTLTAQQPMNNIMRVTLQAMAAVLGGTQSLHTNSYDEALQLPTSQSAEIALRTQQVIASETGITDHVDPLGGSYALEHLTCELEKGALDYIQSIRSQGGVVACINNGYIAGEIMDASYKAQLDFENKRQIVVGVNEFKESAGVDIPSNKISDEIQKNQIEKLRKFKSNRDSALCEKALNKLSEVAKGSENLVPSIMSCVKASCTLGEVSDSLRQVFGEHQASKMI
ncbi:MAG: methylmalonyl-CoA mutase [Bacteriovoracaceae bacterium]|jgi:methylmalonyl-CoA mutase, N-terminal domain|nr:methylmalonyl-CoA mutase [Bacteriovoracaceae bacterium]